MRRHYIASGILLILPIIDFAVAAPALVREKLQAGVDVVRIPEDAVTTLGKRGDRYEQWFEYVENHFAKPEAPPSARPLSSSPPYEWGTEVRKPLPSIPEGPESLSDSDSDWDVPHWPSGSGSSSTMSKAYHGLVGAHAPPNLGPSTKSYHDLTGVHAPLSSPVHSTWFGADHGLMGAHDSDRHEPQPWLQPNLGPSNPRPLTESDSDHRLVVEEPPSRSASPTGFDADHEYEVVHPPPPPGSASPTKSDRRSMGADSRLENLQAVSDASKDKAKESRRISGTTRGVLNAAQRELHR